MPSVPTPASATGGGPRPLPGRPSLRFLKLEAKRRLAAGEFPALHDAQLAIAWEHGQPSWLINPVAAMVKIVAFLVWLAGLAAVVFLWRATSSAYFKPTQS